MAAACSAPPAKIEDFDVKAKKGIVDVFVYDIMDFAKKNEQVNKLIDELCAGLTDNEKPSVIAARRNKSDEQFLENLLFRWIDSTTGDGEQFFSFLVTLFSMKDHELMERFACRNRVYDLSHYEQILRNFCNIPSLFTPSQLEKFVCALTEKGCFTAAVAREISNVYSQKKKAVSDDIAVQKAWRLFMQKLPCVSGNWYWEFMAQLSDTKENISVRKIICPSFEQELKDRLSVNSQPIITSGPVKLQAMGVQKSKSVPTEQNNAPMEKNALSKSKPSTSKQDEKEQGSDPPPLVLGADQPFAKLFGDESSDDDDEPDPSGIEKRDSGIECESGQTPRCSEEDSDTDDEEKLSDVAPAEPLVLRSYQRELSAEAISGKNSIICAPTGSGKTIVAVEIIRHHLEKGDNRKVVFLVPVVNLINQQMTMVKKYLPREFKVKGIRGGQTGLKQVPKSVDVYTHDVLFMTPQILLNMMIDPAPNVDPVPLTVFSMLIFDECHHAAKVHPYNEIMIKYLDMKFGDPGVKLPQIVGMTASLGVGHADVKPQAKSYIFTICANVDAHALCIVEDNVDDLAEHVPVPTDELERVPPVHYSHPFSVHVGNVMAKIEKLIKPIFDLLEKDIQQSGQSDVGQLKMTPPNKRWTAEYSQWVHSWLTGLPTVRDVVAKRNLLTALEHLKVYYNALFLNGHVPTKQAVDYLASKFVKFKRAQQTDMDNILITLYDKEFIPHIQVAQIHKEKNEMVEKLKDILRTEFLRREDGRALVFVATRALTSALVNCLMEDEFLKEKRPARLTGVQASKAQGGQSAKDHLEIVEKFRNGHHRIIIATSVAEEGLDIEKCNLIVKYNHVTSEVAMVQRRGRGRAVGSRSVLLAQQGEIEETEMLNIIREKMMIECVTDIRRMAIENFQNEVAKKQQQAFRDRQINKEILSKRRIDLGDKQYDLLCKKCDSFIVASSDIRRVIQSATVGADATIWQRVKPVEFDTPRIFEEMVQAGKLLCVECGEECGTAIKFANVYLPALKAGAFVQQSRGDVSVRHHVRRWGKISEQLFVVDGLTQADLRVMFAAMKDLNTRKMEEKIKLAEREKQKIPSIASQMKRDEEHA